MKKLLMTMLFTMGLIVCAASLTAESGAKSGSEAAPADTTYTVRGVSFTMKGIAAVTNGSVGHDDERNNKPHTVSLSAYLIGETEVTQELWQAVMGSNPSFYDNTGNKKLFGDTLDTSPGMGEVHVKRPVEQVSWFDCIVFCNELIKKVAELEESQCVYYRDAACNAVYTATDADDGTVPHVKQGANGFRLPTETEWEWAAKGGKEYRWAGTDEQDELKKYAWYDAKNYAWYETCTDQKTHAVKRKRPNGYGLYDMSGNVWEWCWDRYEDRTPSGGQRDPVSATSGSRCVIRGGSWDRNAACATRAFRGSRSPWYSNCFLGLRLACSVHTAKNSVGAGEISYTDTKQLTRSQVGRRRRSCVLYGRR